MKKIEKQKALAQVMRSLRARGFQIDYASSFYANAGQAKRIKKQQVRQHLLHK
ncbi:hypothetical protein SAMN04488134_11368 [Amphibacillus marinus]|uniref:Uncharacterized protein n=1 Tax=Amphibacillus marinus TaxID=872970 RepID=A0A1H8SR45_9BACI|nr:hypothetical protein [Amphibacillus marinus]SEO80784.1 hypothetical protein SAMN04488134_11368 [Amphibacillus marinus]